MIQHVLRKEGEPELLQVLAPTSSAASTTRTSLFGLPECRSIEFDTSLVPATPAEVRSMVQSRKSTGLGVSATLETELRCRTGESPSSVPSQREENVSQTNCPAPTIAKRFLFSQEIKGFPPLPLRVKKEATAEVGSGSETLESLPEIIPTAGGAMLLRAGFPTPKTQISKKMRNLSNRPSAYYTPSTLPPRKKNLEHGEFCYYSIPSISPEILASEMLRAEERGGPQAERGAGGDSSSDTGGSVFGIGVFPGIYTARDSTLLYNEEILAQGRALVNDLLHGVGDLISSLSQATRVAGAIVEYWCSDECTNNADSLEATRTDEKYLKQWAAWGKGVIGEGAAWKPEEEQRQGDRAEMMDDDDVEWEE